MAEAATTTGEPADHVRPEDLAPGWDAQLPADPETRREAFREYHHRRAEQKRETENVKQSWNVNGAKKTLIKNHGWHKHVVAFVEKMEGVTPEERAKIWRQLCVVEADFNWDPQRDLFDLAAVGKTTAPDEPSVFDATHAGETVGAERGDDPGRARKRKSSAEPPAPQPSGDIGASGLAAGIKPLEEPVPYVGPDPVLPEGATPEQKRTFEAAMERGDKNRAAGIVRAIKTVQELEERANRKAKPLEGADGQGSYKLA